MWDGEICFSALSVLDICTGKRACDVFLFFSPEMVSSPSWMEESETNHACLMDALLLFHECGGTRQKTKKNIFSQIPTPLKTSADAARRLPSNFRRLY